LRGAILPLEFKTEIASVVDAYCRGEPSAWMEEMVSQVVSIQRFWRDRFRRRSPSPSTKDVKTHWFVPLGSPVPVMLADGRPRPCLTQMFWPADEGRKNSLTPKPLLLHKALSLLTPEKKSSRMKRKTTQSNLNSNASEWTGKMINEQSVPISMAEALGITGDCSPPPAWSVAPNGWVSFEDSLTGDSSPNSAVYRHMPGSEMSSFTEEVGGMVWPLPLPLPEFDMAFASKYGTSDVDTGLAMYSSSVDWGAKMDSCECYPGMDLQCQWENPPDMAPVMSMLDAHYNDRFCSTQPTEWPSVQLTTASEPLWPMVEEGESLETSREVEALA